MRHQEHQSKGVKVDANGKCDDTDPMVLFRVFRASRTVLTEAMPCAAIRQGESDRRTVRTPVEDTVRYSKASNFDNPERHGIGVHAC